MPASRYSLLFLLGLAFLTTACRNEDEEPLLERFIVTGSVRATDQVYQGPFFPNDFGGTTITLDSAEGISLTFFETNSSSQDYSYVSSSVVASDAKIELAGFVGQDSIMACWNVNSDTTAGSIVRTNTLSGPISCSGQLYFEETRSYSQTESHGSGFRIDETLPWGLQGATLYMSSNYYQPGGGGYPSQSTNLRYTLWPSGRLYLPFRWKKDYHWNYGYVELEVYQENILIHRVVTEQ